MNTHRTSLSRRSLTTAFATVFAALLLSGCQTINVTPINYLRDAQESFNDAAELENQSKLNAVLSGDARQSSVAAEQSLVDLNAARVGFAVALDSLARLEKDEDQVNQLKADKLWGAAQTLKALSQWKTGNADAAIVTANDALQESKDQLFPRDLATLTAIPGLVKIDVAYQLTTGLRSTSEDLNTFNTEIAPRLVISRGNQPSATEILQNARAAVDASHPVNAYLLQAQLAAYINYKVAYQKTHNEEDVPDDDPAKLAAAERLNELKAAYATLGVDANDLLSSYRRLIGL